MPLSRRLYSLLCLATVVVPLIDCGSAHDSDEHYIFVAANVQVPYWQAAAAGFSKAGEQMKVQSNFVGPNTYDPKAERNRIVQVGTQHRSEPYPRAAHDLVQSGVLGDTSKVEIVWNYHGPRWRGRPEAKRVREQDTDWRKWLMTKPYRPFDPQIYCEFRLYREFSSGIPDQWMSHATDLVHWFMNDSFPRSVVAHGGIFAWHDGRENADTFQALLEYPKGFLVSYSTSFGNDAPSFTRYMGKT